MGIRALVFSKKLVAASAGILCVKFLTGCNLPGMGPDKSDILARSGQEGADAFIVEVSENVTRATSTIPSLGFTNQFRNASLQIPEIIRPGDVLKLSVPENKNNGLLTGPAANSAELDAVQVDADDYIFVPYAGRIKQLGIMQTQYAELLPIYCRITPSIHRHKYQDQLETAQRCP